MAVNKPFEQQVFFFKLGWGWIYLLICVYFKGFLVVLEINEIIGVATKSLLYRRSMPTKGLL